MKMRSRTITAGYFANEQLADVGFAERILFTGLWCIADREGRLQNRAKLIRALVFPHDHDVDVDKMIDELIRVRLIYPYEDKSLLWIPTLGVHSAIHPHEKASILPAPPQSIIDAAMQYGNQLSMLNDAPHQPSKKPSKRDPLEFSVPELADLYNQICTSLPQVRKIEPNTKRWRQANARLASTQKHSPGKVKAVWTQIFKKVAASNFLCESTWCGFDWIINLNNLTKIWEGNYDNQRGMTAKQERDHFAKKHRERNDTESNASMGDIINSIMPQKEDT